MSNSWPQVPLGEVLTKSEEWTTINPTDSYREITVRLWGKGVTLRRVAKGSEIASARRLVAKAGQFILSRIDARNGAFGVVPDSLDGAVVSNDFPLFKPNHSRLVPSFLDWMSKTQSFVDICKAASEGTTNRVRLQENRFLTMTISLPSLPEQRRIVARIDELAGKINEARGLRHQAQKEVEALLGSSVSRLCPSSTWKMMTVGELVGEDSLRNGRSVKSSGDIGDVRCLTLSAMRNGRIDIRDNKVVPLNVDEAEPFLVRSGDVFIVRGNGSKNLCGMAGLVTEESVSVISPDLFIHVPLPKQYILPEFFVVAWNSAATREVIEEKAKTTSGIWKVNQGHISSTGIPVPPLSEQRRIVAELDALQAQVDGLKKLQSETAAELDALLPSILDKAFKRNYRDYVLYI
jgi:type I restriction enzyme S subunit